YPNNIGPFIMKTYVPSAATVTGVAATANTLFPGTCGTQATNNLPCATAMEDTASFGTSATRNGTQWNLRIDKYFKNDRISGNFFRTTLGNPGVNWIPQFNTTNNTWERSLQVNWTHTFSPSTLNEAIFGQNRVEGFDEQTGDFSVPQINVTGLTNTAYGIGFAQGDFIQHNYHWRDVLTHVSGTHTLKFGYDGWFGDDVENFAPPYSQPVFSFDNLLQLAQDAPHTEGNARFNPLTGTQEPAPWNAASNTWGLFAEDTWKARQNLTITAGLRWDDYGNPYSRSASTVFGNFYLGPGQTYQEQVANGSAIATHYALNHAVNNLLSPRLGVAWDPTGSGTWVVRAGAGVFNNWLTQANVQEEFRGNPPGPIAPTFVAGSATPPVFSLGTNKTYPFGFTYPTFPGGLNSHGGIIGLNFPIGAINPNLKSPQTYQFAATLERKLTTNLVASVGYSGSHSTDLLSGGNQAGLVSYGADINAKPGDLIAAFPSKVPTRLNSSFGAINYGANNRESNYNAVIFDVRGRFQRAFFDASYTHSRSNDDAGVYPYNLTPHQYYGPSPWDIPNRFSLTFNYQLPGMNNGEGVVGRVTEGWALSGTSIYQSGLPYTPYTNAAFAPNGANTGYAPGSGDFNADGDNFDYPDVPSYSESTSKSAFLTGVFSDPATQFTAPATYGVEGNEKTGQFRGPNFAETDAALYKNTRITEKLNFQIRFEFFNLFNRANLSNFDVNLADLNSNFGKATGQQLPRWWQ